MEHQIQLLSPTEWLRARNLQEFLVNNFTKTVVFNNYDYAGIPNGEILFMGEYAFTK